jgi:hypothetical protein
MKLENSRQIEKNPQVSNFIKIRPEGSEFFHANRQTERRDEADSCFSQYKFREHDLAFNIV